MNNIDNQARQLKDNLNRSIPRSKHIISNVLVADHRTWYCSDEDLPIDDNPVMIRLVDRNQVVNETEEAIIYLEDMKVGRYHAESKTWTIEPPFPKYDYSPLSSKETVKENAEISHWSKLRKDELDSWQCRLKPLNAYSYLTLHVDPEHDEKVYLALIHAMNCIVRVGGESMFSPNSNSELLEHYKVLCDLQAAMDDQIFYSKSNKVCFLLGELDNALNEIIIDAMSKTGDSPNITAINTIRMVNDAIFTMLTKLKINISKHRKENNDAMDN